MKYFDFSRFLNITHILVSSWSNDSWYPYFDYSLWRCQGYTTGKTSHYEPSKHSGKGGNLRVECQCSRSYLTAERNISAGLFQEPEQEEEEREGILFLKCNHLCRSLVTIYFCFCSCQGINVLRCAVELIVLCAYGRLTETKRCRKNRSWSAHSDRYSFWH